MLDVIQSLLILQDRDRKLAQFEAEVASIAPKRESVLTAADSSRTAAEQARQRMLHLESDRKKLELEVVAKQQAIERYSLQQFQTKKNEEYKALSHEIDTCKTEIGRLEDQQLVLMEQGEQAHRDSVEAARVAAGRKQEAERQVAVLDEREATLRRSHAELAANREQLAAAVDPSLLERYERIRRTKGDRVLVNIEHSACGGCHMKLPAQVVLTCRAAQEIAQCPNCGRILFFTSGMDLAVAD